MQAVIPQLAAQAAADKRERHGEWAVPLFAILRQKGGFFVTRNWKKLLIGIVTGFANGLFGSGGGTIVVPAMERFLHMEEHKAHATAIAVILPLSVLSLAIYLWKTGLGEVWQIALWASAGGLVGGVVGAKLLSKVRGIWLHRIFGGFMIVAAVRMLL
ncbi:MAG: sulfite exporter TauE/SafE family protein [Anaerotignum sp.]|nr:sulfite exporter TauE/SafE family protein [Anaerotignum sp.]